MQIWWQRRDGRKECTRGEVGRRQGQAHRIHGRMSAESTGQTEGGLGSWEAAIDSSSVSVSEMRIKW